MSSREQATQSRLEDISSQLDDAKTNLKNLQQELEDLKVEFEEVNVNEDEKEARFFRSLPDLNASFFKGLQEGQVLDLIGGSYHDPHDEMVISRFQYKHDHVKKESEKGSIYEVHGFMKINSDDEWSSCMMLANEQQCETWDCSGTVKKLNDSF
jgi:hypothetical protein